MDEARNLWKRVRDFRFDPPGVQFGFAQRLARENQWPQAFAERVIQEYLRFIYMMAISTHELTPSDQVDQAWHLHLTYSRSYWEELCRDILQCPIHHGPTKGGWPERERFFDQYARTLDFYSETYGEAAPSDIWPDPGSRFHNVQYFQRVNSQDYWMIPRPSASALRMAVSAVALPLFLVACASLGESSEWMVILGLITVVFLVVLIMDGFSSMLRKSRAKRRRDRGGSSAGAAGCGGCGSSSDGGQKADSGGDADGGGGDSGCGGGGCGGCGG